MYTFILVLPFRTCNETHSQFRLTGFKLSFQPSPDTIEKQIRWADGYIFLFSLTDRTTLNYLVYLKDVIEKLKGRDAPLVLVGNKLDLMSAREVTDEDCLELATKFDCPKFEISVADGCQGVLDVMEELMCLLKRDYIKNLSANNPSPGDNKPKSKL